MILRGGIASFSHMAKSGTCINYLNFTMIILFSRVPTLNLTQFLIDNLTLSGQKTMNESSKQKFLRPCVCPNISGHFEPKNMKFGWLQPVPFKVIPV